MGGVIATVRYVCCLIRDDGSYVVAVGWIAYELRELCSEKARRGPSTLTNVSLCIASYMIRFGREWT